MGICESSRECECVFDLAGDYYFSSVMRLSAGDMGRFAVRKWQSTHIHSICVAISRLNESRRSNFRRHSMHIYIYVLQLFMCFLRVWYSIFHLLVGLGHYMQQHGWMSKLFYLAMWHIFMEFPVFGLESMQYLQMQKT